MKSIHDPAKQHPNSGSLYDQQQQQHYNHLANNQNNDDYDDDDDGYHDADSNGYLSYNNTQIDDDAYKQQQQQQQQRQLISNAVYPDDYDAVPLTSNTEEVLNYNYNNNFMQTYNNTANSNNSHCPRMRQPLKPIAPTSTYDTQQRPFSYDKQRGRWSSAVDFYFACTSHAFGTITFSEFPIYGWLLGGVYFLPFYLIAVLLYGIPVFAIQTFLGQFSSSGSISAFRVAPICKGIGYGILVLNLTSLTYYSVIAAFPLVYAVNSLHSTLPWMSCKNSWNTLDCSNHSDYYVDDEYTGRHATAEYFRHIMQSSTDGTNSAFAISYPILYGVLVVWFITLVVLLKRVSFIGKFFRCTCILMMSLFLAIFAYLIIQMQFTWSDLLALFKTPGMQPKVSLPAAAKSASLLATSLLGPGWGCVLSMASHNSFRRDSERLTFWVGATHVVLVFCALICGRIALDHFEDSVGMFHYQVDEDHVLQFLFLCFAYLFGSFTSLPNFWSFLFFAMLFIAELSAVIIQMMTVLTAIFDEYERLRSWKRQITLALVVALAAISVYFCTKQGLRHLDVLPMISLLTNVIISLIVLMVVTWIYGRERFQCDLQFMLGKTISNFKIFILRFVTPHFLVCCILQIGFFLQRDGAPSLMLLITKGSVCLVAFSYMITQLFRTTGSPRNRLKQCFAPQDWHPVDADNRRFYEEVMGISEMLVIIHNNDQQLMAEPDAADA